MKESRRLDLQAKLDQAVAAGDIRAAEAIRATIDRETLECTAHTAERLKRVEIDVSAIKETVFDIKDELRDMKSASNTDKAHTEGVKDGAHWVLELLKLIISAGGGAALIKFLPN
ncbi:MAG: hypothetical protein ACI305_05905 [Lepagella sp.]